MKKSDIAIDFLKLASSGRVKEAYEKYIHPDFFHHNAYFPGDRESLLLAMQKNSKEFPHKVFKTIRTIEEGNLVAVHGWVQLKPDMPKIALMHLFRFENDLIIEEWEVGQETPKDSPNQNGIF